MLRKLTFKLFILIHADLRDAFAEKFLWPFEFTREYNYVFWQYSRAIVMGERERVDAIKNVHKFIKV